MRLGAVVVAEVVFCGGGFYFLFFPHGPGPAFPNSANVDTIVCAHISFDIKLRTCIVFFCLSLLPESLLSSSCLRTVQNLS